MKSKARAGRKPAPSEPITTEAGHASLKTAALGADWFLPYPRPLCTYRKGEFFSHETRVWECILLHVLRHEGDPAATYAQVAGKIRTDGTETGIKNRRRRGDLRPMTQADISIILRMGKGDVSRAVKKLLQRGVLRQEGHLLHLVGSPDYGAKKERTEVACSRNFTTPFLPPPSHPREEAWLADLSQWDQQVTATYNAGQRDLRAAKRADTLEGYAKIAASYLGVEPSELICTTKQADPSTEKSPGPPSKVSGSRNLSSFVRSGSRNKQASKVACSGDHIREERKREDFSEKGGGGLAGHSPITVQGESQPASQPAPSSKQKRRKADRQTDPENLEQFVRELNQQFTRRFAVPATREWAADILRRLKGAEWGQLFDLIKRKPHILGWAGVAHLADDCASTQDTWRAAQPTTTQPLELTGEQRADAHERIRRARKQIGPKRT